MDYSPQTDIKKFKGLAIPEFLLLEKIRRARKYGVLIEDLFLVVPVAKKDEEGETDLNTKEGKLRVFFVSQLYEFHQYASTIPTALLLSHKKFPYPKVNKVSTRVVNKVGNAEPNLIIENKNN